MLYQIYDSIPVKTSNYFLSKNAQKRRKKKLKVFLKNVSVFCLWGLCLVELEMQIHQS